MPPAQDFVSCEVVLESPRGQVAVAAAAITSHLEDVEAKLQQEEELRQAKKIRVVKLDVAPNMRRHVVGPGGETLRRLAQEHPSVRVMVPPPSDTHTGSVKIRGPRDEAAAVQNCLKARLQEVEQQRRLKKKE